MTENNNISNDNTWYMPLADLCIVYAKAKWMRTFKAFDLEGFFVGNLIYATMIENSEDNHRKLQKIADEEKAKGLVFQLRKGGKVLFQTS